MTRGIQEAGFTQPRDHSLAEPHKPLLFSLVINHIASSNENILQSLFDPSWPTGFKKLSNHFTAISSLMWDIVVPQFKIIGTRKKRKERKKIRVRDVSDREVSACSD